MTNRKIILSSSTGDLFFPVRLYYKVNNYKLLKKELKRLKCISFEKDKEDYFFILYYKEAKSLQLGMKYQEIPKKEYPAFLAECHIKNTDLLNIDLESFKSAIGIVDFMIKNIKPFNVIELKSIAHGNEITSHTNSENLDNIEFYYNQLFDGLEDRNFKFEEVTGGKEEKAKKMRKIMEEENKEEKYNYPTAEKININYRREDHEEIISMLRLRSVLKETVAIKRFDGEKHYTTMDAINEIFNKNNNN